MIYVCGLAFGVGLCVSIALPCSFLTLAMVPLFMSMGVDALLALLATSLGEASHFHVRWLGFVAPLFSTIWHRCRGCRPLAVGFSKFACSYFVRCTLTLRGG
ncbi:hypothetical protein KP509_01G027200 [Ceratopteris richardii]|uniref:Uncharacterized protein n=1 Tax=Ceratopteris richardii TaxID=49495 RepID=A0A8T2VBP1_CERRI|nr:hypothetical protein KP509_01G027200 [Ceratopteris richardii]